MQFVYEVCKFGSDELGFALIFGSVERFGGSEFDDRFVIGVERIVGKEFGGECQVAAVKQQDGLRVDGQHQVLHIEAGGTGHGDFFVAFHIERAWRHRVVVLMTDQGDHFRARLEVAAPQADLWENREHGLCDDAKLVFADLIEWQPLNENATRFEAVFDVLIDESLPILFPGWVTNCSSPFMRKGKTAPSSRQAGPMDTNPVAKSRMT